MLFHLFSHHQQGDRKVADNLYSYFPGCSLATTAKENNASLSHFAERMGIQLVELEDWNCCGSSSAHSINTELADQLAMRNLSLAPEGRPLLIACPSCNLRLQQAQIKLNTNAGAQQTYRERFAREADPNLAILHFFDLLDRMDWKHVATQRRNSLRGLKFAPYYGCMLARPPAMRRQKNYRGIMERILTGLGATALSWGYASRCCGTFLSVVRPDVVAPMVQQIVSDAKRNGADGIVTACAMCHLNLELRSNPSDALPVFHFSEILALTMGDQNANAYFERHLIDPRPVLRRCRLGL
jgi:heterodisulfide reductase subunit B